MCWQINFEDCWLEYVDPVAFSGLGRLSALNLVNNELRTLNSAIQLTLASTLRVVRLYRNPWTCDCRLRWLRRWLVSRAGAGSSSRDVDSTVVNWDFASNTPTCAAPALIRGVAWRHLTPDQFACPSRIVAVSAADADAGNRSTTTGIRAIAGRNATVKCTAAGDPEPVVSWSRGDGGGGQVLAPPRALISVRQGSVGDDGEPRIVSVLTVVGVTAAQDAGVYSCMAENTAGRAEMTFKLIVDDAPSADASSDEGHWPVDRDAFLGTLFALLAVVALVVLCTALRLGSIARRRRRLLNKKVYYVANTATNHVGPSPTSNHRPPADIESTALAHAAVNDDEDSKSSDEQSSTRDGRAFAGSPKYPLLPSRDRQWSERAEESVRCGGTKRRSEASSRRKRGGSDCGESRDLLSPDTVGDLVSGDLATADDVGDDDEVSLSGGDSDDLGDATTNGDSAANYRERPSRAVSFGPDMIISSRRCSSSGADPGGESPHDKELDAGEVKRCSDDENGRQNVYPRRDEEQPVFQRPAVDGSPSAGDRPVVTQDRQATSPSPRLTVGDSPSLSHIGVVSAGRRHSGEMCLVGNGSVRGGPPASHRVVSPQTTATAAPLTRCRPSSTHSASLERDSGGNKHRRRLPIPVVPGLLRPSPRLGVFGVAGGRYQRGAASPRVAALPGNHVAAGDSTPVSLAELLAPPFGGGARQSRPARHCLRTDTDSRRSSQLHQRDDTNCIFDDDSGTDI